MAIVDGRGDGRCWLIAGRCCTAAGWLLWLLMQALANDPFPPEISVSQYGLGGFGWVFTVWALTLAAAPLLLLRGAPVPGPAGPLLWIGFAGAAVMAVVRTDEGGGAMSGHAQVHMIGSIVALVFLPVGILFAVRGALPSARVVASVLVAASAVTGGLVVLSAIGVDTAGLGPARSWALWQGILLVLDLLLVTVYAIAAGTGRPQAGDRRRLA